MTKKAEPGFVRMVAEKLLTTEHFKNNITLLLVASYCYMVASEIKVDSQFALLVGMVLGFYFKRDGDGQSPDQGGSAPPRSKS